MKTKHLNLVYDDGTEQEVDLPMQGCSDLFHWFYKCACCYVHPTSGDDVCYQSTNCYWSDGADDCMPTHESCPNRLVGGQTTAGECACTAVSQMEATPGVGWRTPW